MHRKLLLSIGTALLLSGCAAIDQLRQQVATGRSSADAQLVYLDRLNRASPEELGAIGERLGASESEPSARTPLDSLRYALWQSTPGHAGYAPDEARQRLEGLLSEGWPPQALQALMRVQLRHLRHLQAQSALQAKNAELEAANGERKQEIQSLEKKIQALTTLERRMGGGGGSGQP